MSLQSRKTFFHLYNINEDIFDKIRVISVPPYTAMELPLRRLKEFIKRL